MTARNNNNSIHWGWPSYNSDIEDSNLTVTVSMKVERNGDDARTFMMLKLEKINYPRKEHTI